MSNLEKQLSATETTETKPKSTSSLELSLKVERTEGKGAKAEVSDDFIALIGTGSQWLKQIWGSTNGK